MIYVTATLARSCGTRREERPLIVPGSPTVRRRRLAAELRGIRESKGKSGDAVAAALKWSPSKVSRYERARTGLHPREVERLLDYYQVTAPHAPARPRPGRVAEGLVGGVRRWPLQRLPAVHRAGARGKLDRHLAHRR